MHLTNAHRSEVLAYFQSCQTRQTFVNVEFICKNGFLCYSHKVLLSSFSSFLRQILRSQTNEQMVSICLPEFESRTVDNLLAFLYTGTVVLGTNEERSAFLQLSDLFKISLPVAEWSPQGVFIAPPVFQKLDESSGAEECSGKSKRKKLRQDDSSEDEEECSKPKRQKEFGQGEVDQVKSDSDDNADEVILDGVPVEDVPEEEYSPLEVYLPEVPLETSGDLDDYIDIVGENPTMDDPNDPDYVGETVTQNQKIRCAYCNFGSFDVNQILRHIILTHFRYKYEYLYEKYKAVCPECGRHLTNIEEYAEHLGIEHEFIFKHLVEVGQREVVNKLKQVPKKVTKKELVNKLKPVPKTTNKSKALTGATTTPSEVPPACYHCGLRFPFSKMSLHIARLHRGSFKDVWLKNDKKCPLCPQQDRQLAYGHFVDHYGGTHRQAFRLAGLPEAFTKELNEWIKVKNCRDSKNVFKDEK